MHVHEPWPTVAQLAAQGGFGGLEVQVDLNVPPEVIC